MVKIELHQDVTSFYQSAFAHLCESEAQNCWPIGLVCSLLAEPEKESVNFWTVEEDNRVLGAAWLSHQQVLGFSQIPGRAGQLLADAIAELKLRPTGVAGLPEICDAFCDAWTSHQNARVRQTVFQRIHQLHRVEEISNCPGNMQVAKEENRQLLIEWERSFCVDCHVELNDEQIYRVTHQAIAKGSRYFWVVDGTPRSMAEHRGETPSGVRISYVFTPQEYRGRGYASALVAQLSQKMLDAGKKFCFLYTDIANPTSNRIYHKIGYRPVCDTVHHIFAYESA